MVYEASLAAPPLFNLNEIFLTVCPKRTSPSSKSGASRLHRRKSVTGAIGLRTKN
jgi:hypothetical protein